MPPLTIYNDAFIDENMERMLRRMRIIDSSGPNSPQDRNTAAESAVGPVESTTDHNRSTRGAVHEVQSGPVVDPLIRFRSPQRLQRLEEALRLHQSSGITRPTSARDRANVEDSIVPVSEVVGQAPTEVVDALIDRTGGHQHQPLINARSSRKYLHHPPTLLINFHFKRLFQVLMSRSTILPDVNVRHQLVRAVIKLLWQLTILLECPRHPLSFTACLPVSTLGPSKIGMRVSPSFVYII
jgi:hypothetical protein